MATDYSKYNQSQYDNQSKYLDNLINNGTAGQKAWAEAEKNSLNSQYKPQTQATQPSTPSVQSKPATGNSGSNSGKTDYSGYNESQYNNQKTYLDNIIAANGGHDKWAEAELESLNNQYQGNKNNTVTNNPVVNNVNKPATSQPAQTLAQQEAIANNSNGKYGTSADNKYGTIHKYTKDGGYYTSTDGGKTFINAVTGEQMAGNTAQSSAGLTGGWNSIGSGKSGKQYEVSGTGSIIVTYSDGSYRLVNPTDSDYMVTRNAMAQDLADNGINYVPSYTWSVTQDHYKLDGSGELDYSQDVAYTKKDYLTGNTDLQHALEQWMKNNGTNKYDIEAYAKELYNNIGTQRADGSVITLADVDKELDRLGLSDYNSQNAIYTSSGSLLPNNPFVDFTTGQVIGGGGDMGLDYSNGEFANYNGQQYLIGGDVANFLNYVNGKTGNTTNLDFIFDDMANNPYAKEDAEFAQSYQDALNQFNASAGIQTPIQAPTTGSTGTGGSYTGYDDVDQFIDYVNSVNGFNQATGTTGSDLWSEIKAMLEGGYESQQAFIDSKRIQAEQNAEDLMREAYVANKLQGDSVKEAMSAAGLGTTGAMQSAMLGVQSNYNNNVADIRSNLASMIANFDEQKLKALTDYMNKSTDFYYQIRNDEADIAKQNAQMYLQMLEMQQAQEQQKWENLYKQQLLELENQQYKDQWDWEKQQYSDALKQQEFENSLAEQELALKRKSASGYYNPIDGSVPIDDESGNGEIAIDNNGTTGTKSESPISGMSEEEYQNWVNSMLFQSQAGIDIVNGLNQAVTPQTPTVDINQLANQSMGIYNAMAGTPTANPTMSDEEYNAMIKKALAAIGIR